MSDILDKTKRTKLMSQQMATPLSGGQPPQIELIRHILRHHGVIPLEDAPY